jgi:hypothetical protein
MPGWEESKHPRAGDGKFGSGGGSSPSRSPRASAVAKAAVGAKRKSKGAEYAKNKAAVDAMLARTQAPRAVEPPGPSTPSGKLLDVQRRERDATAAW